MKPIIHLTLCAALMFGCSPTPSQPDLLTPGFFIPTLAAAAAIGTESKTPVTPPSPDNPTGVCPNCNGKGRVGDGTVETICVVCDGTGKVTNAMTAKRHPGFSTTPLITGDKTVLGPVTEGHPTNGVSGQTQPAEQADDYSQIDWVPIEQAQAKAKAQGRPIWIHVYAEQGCRECKRLEISVFPDKELVKASRDFVCSKVPFGHPWYNGLSGGGAVPLDLFGSADSWKTLRRYRCPTTAINYVKQLQSQGATWSKTQSPSPSRSVSASSPTALPLMLLRQQISRGQAAPHRLVSSTTPAVPSRQPSRLPSLPRRIH
jgi:hypothetical protein